MKIYNKTIDTKPSIVLDIDDTLIKTKIYVLNDRTNYLLKFYKNKNHYLTNYTIGNYLYIVYSRPYLKQFIITMNKYFNIHIYSLGMLDYVENIINAIVESIDFNPFCHLIANTNIENRILSKRLIDLDIGFSNVLIIDDRSDVWLFDKHNLYKIPKYDIIDSTKLNFNIIDNELLKLIKIISTYFEEEKDKSIFEMYKFKQILYDYNFL